MGSERDRKLDEIRKFERLLEKQTGKAVRPYRADSYVNLLNRYGTSKDTTEHYRFQQEPPVPDDMLTAYYEGNGLFAKIIDTPAEEAIKHGFEMTVKDQEIQDFYKGALDELDWEETAMTAIKWARLFGGSIVVMLINDGRGLEEPVDWKNIRSIDDLRVYDRSVIQEDTSSMFAYRPDDPFRTRSSRLGMPEYYDVFSRYGHFRVHDSRCLVFQNGLLPENTTNSIYQMWGIPEYIRINRAIRDAEVAHGSAIKLLDRSIQAVYKMKDLAAELATEEGEDRVLRRLQTIDMARGLLNSITIDADGEDYDFRTFQFTGVSDVVDSACNYLSALTSIPQTILFGRSPAGMNSTGESDLENWYNYLERIQSRMVKKNLRYLLSIIFQAGVACGEVDEVPEISIEFNPLWSTSESEQAAIDQQKAQTQQVRAQTAQIYMDAQVIDPSEVRRKLADSDEFDIENMLDEIDEEDLFANMPQGGDDDDMLMGGGNAAHSGMPGNPSQTGSAPQENPPAENATEAQGKIPEKGDFSKYAEGVDVEEHNTDPGTEGSAPTAAPAATKLPEDMSEEEKEKAAEKKDSRSDEGNSNSGNHGHSGRPGEIGGSQPNGGSSGDVSKWSSMPGSEVAKEVSKYGVGSTVQITNRRGKTFTFTKTGDNQWSRSDQPGQTYEDIGVGLNCWKSEIKATAKSSEMPEENRKAEESAEKETEALAKKAESEAAPAATGKYADLGNKAADISQSDMSKEEKGEAYIQMVQDIEPGTTFKVNGTEYRKGTDPDYPYEMIDYKGDYVNAMSSLDFDLTYYADKEGCLTFFDKDAEVQQRKDLAAEMEASGKFSASDEVHGAKEGKITESSENFGEPGDYVVYRNGNVGSSGMIFYSPVKEGADQYASQHENGNTSEYEVHLDNPLVIRGDTDVACIRAAYNALHPDKPLKGELTSSKWISCDKQNATALNSGNSGYDSVIYIIGGKPSEVQVSAKKVKSDKVKKTAEYTTTAWSRTGCTYQEAAIRGLVTSDTEDYKRVDGRSDSGREETVHCSRGRYDEVLKEYGGVFVLSDDEDPSDTAQNSPKATKTDANGEDNNLSTIRPKRGSVGVLVVEDGCILSGIRKSGFAPGLVCGPGGHVEDGETHEQAAIRETQEEFGITPKGLIQLGFGPWEPDTGLKPAVFLATEHEGALRNTDEEMGDLRFRSLAELREMDKAMFQPFADAIDLMLQIIGPDHFDGGPGSGNHGHGLVSASDLATAFNSAISKNGDKEQNYLDRYLKNDIIKLRTQNTSTEAFQALEPEDIAFIAEEFGVDVSDATEGELRAVMAMLRMDGGPGSGNHGHKGVKGQRGGSAPKGSESSSGSGEKKAKATETTVKKFGGASTKNFVKSLSEAKATVPEESRWRVDTYTEETMDREHPGANLHVTDGGSTVAVTSDGDIISVCHKEGDTQRGRDLLEAAVANGGTKLDAFGPVLYSFYTRNKFEPVSWTPFNKDYAPEGWDASRDSEEPVIFYKYTGKVTSQSYSDFISNTAPCEGDDGYEKAGKLRDESMEG